MSRDVSATSDFDVVADSSGATLQTGELQTETIKKRSMAGIVSYVFRTVFLNGVAIATQLVLSGLLNDKDYGVYGLVVTMSGFFNIISDIGLAASLIQKKDPPTTEELRTVFTVQQGLTWLVFLLTCLTSYFLYTHGKLSLEGLYLAAAFGISFPIVSFKTISSILLERQLEFNKLVIPNIAETLISNAVLIVLALKGFGVRSFTYSVLIKAISGVIIMLALKRWDMGLGFSKRVFMDLMKIGTRFQLNDMLAKTKDDLFYLTVAMFMPTAQYGYITWAKLWSRLPYSLTVDNVTAITFPAFSRLQHDHSLLKRGIEKTIFFVTLIAFPMFAGLGVMITPFIHVFPVYLKWQPAILSLGLFSFSLAFASFSTPLVNALNAIGKVGQTLKIMVFWTAAQWALYPLLYVKFGYQAVPLISAILSLTSIVVVFMVRAHVKFDFLDQIWRQTLATLTMMAVLFEMSQVWSRSPLYLVLGVVLGGAIYVSLMVVTGFEKIRGETLSLIKKR